MQIENRILAALQSQLDTLDDPRRGQGKRHRQGLVLLIVLLATISGYLGYRAMEDFLTKDQAQLLTLFQPEKGRMPSYSTIRRVLMGVDFQQFTQIYKNWIAHHLPRQPESAGADWMSVDGKSLRGTASPDYVHLVSIFSSFDKVVLDTGKVDKKSNEIPLVQRMIAESGLKEVIYTMDALHCQKKRPRSLSRPAMTM
ncbi:MAG: ISAs1 family transposase [Bacteroidetes bacterium]|nr:ISAs1 family transposase [Bacteroidota bacterium]